MGYEEFLIMLILMLIVTSTVVPYVVNLVIKDIELRKPKYKLLYDDKKFAGTTTLYRIQSLRNFGEEIGRSKKVKRGDLGGYIESEFNLSQEGNCWVDVDGQVRGKARVFGDAWIGSGAYILGNAMVFENAKVYNALVYENAMVYGYAEVKGGYIYQNSRVFGRAVIGECSKRQRLDGNLSRSLGYKGVDFPVFNLRADRVGVRGNAKVYGEAQIAMNTVIFGNAEVYGQARIFGGVTKEIKFENDSKAMIFGNAKVYGAPLVLHNAQIFDDAQVGGEVIVCGNSKIYKNAIVKQSNERYIEKDIY